MFNLEIIKNLPSVETTQLELMYLVITNKEFKEQISQELFKREGLKSFKVIETAGFKKKEVKTNFEKNEVLLYMVKNDIDITKYLDSFKIIEEYGKELPKELFQVEIIEVEKKPLKYLKKVGN